MKVPNPVISMTTLLGALLIHPVLADDNHRGFH